MIEETWTKKDCSPSTLNTIKKGLRSICDKNDQGTNPWEFYYEGNAGSSVYSSLTIKNPSSDSYQIKIKTDFTVPPENPNIEIKPPERLTKFLDNQGFEKAA